MASDVLRVMEALHLEEAGLVGWSDGAATALLTATKAPGRITACSSTAATWTRAT